MFDQGGSNSQGLEPMQEWRLPKSLIKNWTMTLHKTRGEQKDKEVTTPLNQQRAGFESVTLYRYFNDNYILAFRVMPKALQELREKRDNAEEVGLFAEKNQPLPT